MRRTLLQAGGSADAELAVALIENSSRCPTSEDGEKLVPGDVPWIVDLVEKVGWRAGLGRGSEGQQRQGNNGKEQTVRQGVLLKPPCCRSHAACIGRPAAPALPPSPPHACLPAMHNIQVAEVALNVAPFEYDPRAAAKASNPNRRRKWLIPVVLAAQVGGAAAAGGRAGRCSAGVVHAAWGVRRHVFALNTTSNRHTLINPNPCPPAPKPCQVALKLVLDRVMDEDGCRGDANGPFDKQTVKERREELKRDKVGRAEAFCLLVWRGQHCCFS